jgi:hypothetical protein
MLTDNGACSPAATAAAAGSHWNANSSPSASCYATAGPTTRKPAARSNDCTRPLKKWLHRQPAATTLGELQTQLDTFTTHYNQHRPHHALNRATPEQAWHARPRAPCQQGVIIDKHFRVLRDRIDTNGTLTLRHNSRLHHIGIDRPHTGTRVLVLALDRHIRIITEDGELLRDLQLDPSRNYQPKAKHPRQSLRVFTMSRDTCERCLETSQWSGWREPSLSA